MKWAGSVRGYDRNEGFRRHRRLELIHGAEAESRLGKEF